MSEAMNLLAPDEVAPRSRSRRSRTLATSKKAATAATIDDADCKATISAAPRRPTRAMGSAKPCRGTRESTIQDGDMPKPTTGVPKPRPRRATTLATTIPRPPDATIQSGHVGNDTLRTFAAPEGGQTGRDSYIHPENVWPLLGFFSATVDDLERVRIAMSNRIGAMQRMGMISGMNPTEDAIKGIEAIERGEIRLLEKTMRSIPGLGDFVMNTKGLGLKSAARFLACVGHPRIRPVRGPAVEGPDGKMKPGPILRYEDRTVSQLWRYCGLDVQDGKAPRRQKGVKGNWNAIARKRAYVMAEPCIKHRSSPYRIVYEDTRLKYAEAEISDMHKHRRAIRAVMKAIVKDLWRAAIVESGTIWLPPLSTDTNSEDLRCEASRGTSTKIQAPRSANTQ